MPPKDVATWLCLTIRAATGSTFVGNDRSRPVIDALWARLASICNFQSGDTTGLYQSLIDEVVHPAIDLSRHIRMCRSKMWVRFGISNEPGSESILDQSVSGMSDFLQVQPRLTKETRSSSGGLRPVIVVDLEKVLVTVIH